MRTFSIILFTFFILFLIGALFISDPLVLFITIFLGFIIALICVRYYLWWLRGAGVAIIFIIAPFLIDYLLFRFNLPFFETPLISGLEFNQIEKVINLSTLFSLFTLPLLFISALYFSQKIKIFSNIKNYHKTFLIIVSTILISLNFLNITISSFNYQVFLKWLIIALIVNLLAGKLFIFQTDIPEIYKELPIILFLAIYGTNALKQLNSLNLILTLVLALIYFYILYQEYKIRKITRAA